MKKIVLLLTLLLISGTTKAARIPDDAWNNLRDIQAWHVENVDGNHWEPGNTDASSTNAFLANTLKPYFFSAIEENKTLNKQNQKLTKERDEAFAKVSSRTAILWGLAAVILILCAVIVLIIIRFRPRPDGGEKEDGGNSEPVSRPGDIPPSVDPDDVIHSSDKLRCPRCGSERQSEETECKRCKTHF